MKGGVNELRAVLETLQKKLVDPSSTDDPRWVRRWIAACEAEIAKKERGKKRKDKELARAAKRNEQRATDLEGIEPPDLLEDRDHERDQRDHRAN